ncbi:MAG TPA: DUF2156 domain-containing protein [Ktedonobacteraceae bacterium]|jgi:phosphatidylglycerol lysyltransferase
MNISQKASPYAEESHASVDCREAELVHAYGSHALAFFGLAPENARFLAPGGAGLISYRVVGNVAVMLGDPICASQAREQVIQAFLDFCALRRWRVVIYQASSELLAPARTLKLHTFKMGEEAILNPQTFTLGGSTMANVRTSCRRAERDGVKLQWYEETPPPEMMLQLQNVSDTWLTQKAGRQTPERGFCMGRLDELPEAVERANSMAALFAHPYTKQDSSPAVPRLITEVALTHSGTVCAFVTFTPTYGHSLYQTVEADDASVVQGGWTLDLMRRTQDAPPCVMELLLVRAIERLRSYGASRISLGMVALADTEQQMTPLQRRLVNFASDHLGLLASRHSLFKFKQKFHPEWESRYLISPKLFSLRRYLALLRLRNGTEDN